MGTCRHCRTPSLLHQGLLSEVCTEFSFARSHPDTLKHQLLPSARPATLPTAPDQYSTKHIPSVLVPEPAQGTATSLTLQQSSCIQHQEFIPTPRRTSQFTMTPALPKRKATPNRRETAKRPKVWLKTLPTAALTSRGATWRWFHQHTAAQSPSSSSGGIIRATQRRASRKIHYFALAPVDRRTIRSPSLKHKAPETLGEGGHHRTSAGWRNTKYLSQAAVVLTALSEQAICKLTAIS